MAWSRPDEPLPDNEALLAGRYTVGEPIGRGRSTVHRGEDRRLLRRVAIKEVRLAGGQEDADRVRRRAMREAHAAARLNNPHVVTVYDVVEEGGSIWLVMELVDAPSLAKIVTDQGAMSHRRAARIGLGVLSALETAHAVGVVHRDVKPANVLVGEDDRTKLADFGVASIRDESQLTAIGSIIGSPAYMAPEQAMAAKVGPPADLWALGATLYFAVEGKPPFAGDSALATATAVVTGEPRPQQSVGPLSSLIDRLLAKEPGRRPGAGHVRAVLAAAAATDNPRDATRTATTRTWTASTLRSRIPGRRRDRAEPGPQSGGAAIPPPPDAPADPAPTPPTANRLPAAASPATESPDTAQPADVSEPQASPAADRAPEAAKPAEPADVSGEAQASSTVDRGPDAASPAAEAAEGAESADVSGEAQASAAADRGPDAASPAAEASGVADVAGERGDSTPATGVSDEVAAPEDDGPSSAPSATSALPSMAPPVEPDADVHDRESSAIDPDAGEPDAGAEGQESPADDRESSAAGSGADGVRDGGASVVGPDVGGLHEPVGSAGEGGEAEEDAGDGTAVAAGAGAHAVASPARAGDGQMQRVVVPAPGDDELLASGLEDRPLIDLDDEGRRGSGLAALRSALSGDGQRRVVIAVVVVVALVAAGLGARSILADDREPAASRGTEANGATDDAAQDAPSTSAPASTDATSETTAATTPEPPPAPPADGEVPADWVRYQDPSAGYVIAHPPGWRIEPAGDNMIDIRDPATGSYLRIDWTDSPQPDPVADWRSQASRFAGRHQGYQEIQIAPYTYRDYNAGMWEFRYQEGGAQLHAANLGFVTNNRGYALFFQTHEGRWAQSQDIYAAFRASFQPAP